jgi:hypothetical protein
MVIPGRIVKTVSAAVDRVDAVKFVVAVYKGWDAASAAGDRGNALLTPDTTPFAHG